MCFAATYTQTEPSSLDMLGEWFWGAWSPSMSIYLIIIIIFIIIIIIMIVIVIIIIIIKIIIILLLLLFITWFTIYSLLFYYT